MITVSSSFAKFKEIARRDNRVDFFVVDQQRALSMDFDLKRKPIRSSLYSANPTINKKVYEIGCFDTEPYDTIAEYEHYKAVGRNMKVLRTFKNWVMFFDKIEAKQDGTRRIVRDLEWSMVFSCVMAFRLKVPMSFNGDQPVNIPFLSSNEHSVEEKCDWINQFNHSQKVFGLNDWKNSRKQIRISQMLPEEMFSDLLQSMMEWDGDYDAYNHQANRDDLYPDTPPEDEIFIVPDDDD